MLLDKDHGPMIVAAAKKLQETSLAVMWKNRQARLGDKPSNLFIHKDVDRQDLIGKGEFKILYL